MPALAVFLFLCFSSVLARYQTGHKIIDGEVASSGQFPFAVGVIYYTDAGRHFCTGSIIDKRWILTAAHCIYHGIEFEIYLGINNLNEATTNGVVMRATKWIAYEDYNATTLEHDIGLISLASDIPYTARIQPIDLPVSSIAPYVETIAIGWGATSDDQLTATNELQHVSLTTISNAVCRRTYGEVVTDNVVCVSGNGNQGICGGDSGGPLVRLVSEGQYLQVGVASFYSGDGCETTQPSGFTRTFEYVEWIRDKIGVEDDGNNSAPTTPSLVVTMAVIFVCLFLSF